RVLGSISLTAKALLFQTLAIPPVILITLDRHAEAAGGPSFLRTATVPFRNPVILASALGITSSAVGFRPPAALLEPLTLLSSVALPAALIALGASLYRGEPALHVRATHISSIPPPHLSLPPPRPHV